MSNVNVTVIGPDSALLEEVTKLHRADSHRLGFFPKGAFIDHARARQILLACDNCGKLLGYLLYRVARERAMIVHLCTAPNARRNGVARILVEHLKRITKRLAGIGLHCRQDYDARHVWAKFGFAAIHRKIGRSHDGHELTFWWFDHGHPDLFSFAAASDGDRQKVVVDANVFYDLHGCQRTDSEDSKALLADWVQATIQLCVTKEIYNEIDRAGTSELRARSKAAASTYAVLKSDDALFQRTCEELRPLFPESAVLRDESDLRQVAYAIAGEAAYLVTRDERLADRCEPLYERYGLQVLHPAELISSLDVVEREAQYRPARIEGSQLQTRAIKREDLEMVTSSFRNKTREKVNDFRKAVLHSLSKPREIETKFVTDRDHRPVILAIVDRSHEGLMEVSTLRAAEHSLAATMVRNFLRTTLEAATREGRRLITVTDAGACKVIGGALAEFGFVRASEKWSKMALRLIGDISALRNAAMDIASLGADQPLMQTEMCAIKAAENFKDPDVTAAVESRFWPAKVIGSDLPTFIVSIRAEWARHFFDSELASQFLFGTREELLLGVEGAYYCSSKHSHLTAPARILWYESRGGDGSGAMSIKACSRLEEVVIGKPKELFKRFRRLGVFQWKDVYQAAKNDIKNDVLAFRFSMTERFQQPFTLDNLVALGIRQPLLAPRRISDSQFATIYSHGCALR